VARMPTAVRAPSSGGGQAVQLSVAQPSAAADALGGGVCGPNEANALARGETQQGGNSTHSAAEELAQPSTQVVTAGSEAGTEEAWLRALESEHVHRVYDAIASHFGATRCGPVAQAHVRACFQASVCPARLLFATTAG
jgi:hypothetical protein